MKKAGVFWALIILIVLTGCTSSPSSSPSSSSRNSGKQPDWVSDVYSAYTEDDYLAVLGEGDSLSQAQAKAASNMSLIFESRIMVDSTVESRFVEMRTGGAFSGSSEETSVTDKISQLSDQTLMNLKYGESWTNSMGKVIVVAYLNRQETAELYRSRMNEQSQVLNRLKSDGDRAVSKLARYAYYDSAYVIAMANEVMREQLEIISPASARLAGSNYDLNEIKSARSDASDDMSFRMEFTGDDEGKAQAALAETLTEMGFSVGPDGDIAVAGSVRSEKIERANDYKNYKWYLVIDVVDESDKVIIAVNESGTSASTSDSAALSRVNTDVKKVINKEFEKQFNSYLNSFTEK
ncbi:MAG: LPP20 family lipoprotein [Spirochaetales bacterium]|nr:LPP20 family lipoprotein [Spirochaetales bacterium]